MKSSAHRIGLAVLLFSLAGCGLKGPLYLPDEPQQAVPPTETPKPVYEGSKVRTLPPAPQAQKKERERANQQPPEPAESSESQPMPVSPPDPDRPATTPPPGQ